jgi:hypothetical protein
MGRSVSYLDYAETVIYFNVEGIREDENGEVNDDIYTMECEDLISNLKYGIKAKLKSYEVVDKWDGRETQVILENNLCKIGVSEYCGSWSLSVAVLDFNYYDKDLTAFAKNHANKIKGTLEKCIENAGGKVMYRMGTFSNGCNVYSYKKEKEA